MHDCQSTIDRGRHQSPHEVDLRGLPPVYVLAAHLSINEQHEAEDALSNGGASLTYNINEANLVLGNISKPRRAKSELQWKGLRVQNIDDEPNAENFTSPVSPEVRVAANKRRKLGERSDDFSQQKIDVVVDSSTDSQTEDEGDAGTTPPPTIFLESFTDRVKVIKLDWLKDSLRSGKALPLEPYTIYTGRLLPPENLVTNRPASTKVNGLNPSSANKSADTRQGVPREIIDRASSEPKPAFKWYIKRDRIKDAANKDFVGNSFSSSAQVASQQSNRYITRPTHLLHQTTSEHEKEARSALPPMPDWVRENKIYACQRATPLISPNQAFICQLKKIKLARLLTLDEIGVRAYSSTIASLAAYPYPIQSTREILALPRSVHFRVIFFLFSTGASIAGHVVGAKGSCYSDLFHDSDSWFDEAMLTRNSA